jgi:hypothetical protein
MRYALAKPVDPLGPMILRRAEGTAEAVRRALPELQKLILYERRAVTMRDRALRESQRHNGGELGAEIQADERNPEQRQRRSRRPQISAARPARAPMVLRGSRDAKDALDSVSFGGIDSS